MKKISKVIHYWFLKPTREDGEYFFIRTKTEGLETYTWFIGYENKSGLVSSIGEALSGTLVDELEKEFQSTL